MLLILESWLFLSVLCFLFFLCFLQEFYGYGFYVYAFNAFLYIMWDKDLILFFCMYILLLVYIFLKCVEMGICLNWSRFMHTWDGRGSFPCQPSCCSNAKKILKMLSNVKKSYVKTTELSHVPSLSRAS